MQMLLLASGGHLLFITPVMFAVYMTMMHGWNRAVGTLAPMQESEEKLPLQEQSDLKKPELKSNPLSDIEDEKEVVYLTESVVPWDDDRESIGSSVVEFHAADLDDLSSNDNVRSHPVPA